MEKEDSNIQQSTVQDLGDKNMRKSRFTNAQINSILTEVEAGSKAKDICKKHGLNLATFYYWKTKFRGKRVSKPKPIKATEEKNPTLESRLVSESESKLLKVLEDENSSLKIMLAEAMLDNRMLKAVISKNSRFSSSK